MHYIKMQTKSEMQELSGALEAYIQHIVQREVANALRRSNPSELRHRDQRDHQRDQGDRRDGDRSQSRLPQPHKPQETRRDHQPATDRDDSYPQTDRFTAQQPLTRPSLKTLPPLRDRVKEIRQRYQQEESVAPVKVPQAPEPPKPAAAMPVQTVPPELQQPESQKPQPSNPVVTLQPGFDSATSLLDRIRARKGL